MTAQPRYYDMILRGGTAVTPAGSVAVDIAVQDGRIAALGDLTLAEAGQTVPCSGLHILPGVIDTQVHFREPGAEHKEDLETGTRAAAAGGVTAVFEMPNTRPLTITRATFLDKIRRMEGRAWTDFAFFIGGTADNAEALPELERLPGCAGVKVFMGSSTGDLLVADEEALRRILRNGRRRMSVHAEDEARLRERFALVEGGADPSQHPVWRDEQAALMATERLVRLARQVGRRVQVLHITTEQEMALLAEYRDVATVEVTPQHLTFAAPDAYQRLGTLAQMNPPIRDERHRAALWRALAEGTVDVIGSDHAPHTLEEKRQPYPASPSGMTGVQTLVPVMLNHVALGALSLQRLVDLTSAGPARAFGIAGKGRIARGYDADFTIVDLKARRKIEDAWIRSKAGWTPYDGLMVTGWPVMTVIRGTTVMREDELLGPPAGQAVRFLETLPAAPEAWAGTV